MSALRPSVSDTYDLGATGARWNNLYANHLYLGPTGTIQGVLQVENAGDFIGATGPTGPMGEAFQIDANGHLTDQFNVSPTASLNNFYLFLVDEDRRTSPQYTALIDFPYDLSRHVIMYNGPGGWCRKNCHAPRPTPESHLQLASA